VLMPGAWISFTAWLLSGTIHNILIASH
jgi:hypothetical protein